MVMWCGRTPGANTGGRRPRSAGAGCYCLLKRSFTILVRRSARDRRALTVPFNLKRLPCDEIARAVDAAQLQHVVANARFDEDSEFASRRNRYGDLADADAHDLFRARFERQPLHVWAFTRSRALEMYDQLQIAARAQR